MATRHTWCLAAVLLFANLASAGTLGKCTGGNPNGTVGDNSADFGGITLDLGDCSWTDYAWSRWYAGIPVALGVLLWIVGPLYVCFRACCCQCDDESSATSGRVCCVRSLIMIFIILAAGGCVIVVFGSRRGHKAYNEMFEGLEGVPQYILDANAGLISCMQGVDGFDPSDLAEVTRQANNFKDAVSDAKKTADKFEKPRTIAMPVFVGAAGFLVVLFGLYAFCCSTAGKGCPCASFLSGSFFFVAAFVLIVSGLGFAVWVMGNDTCPELQKQLDGEQNLFSGLPVQACNQTGLQSATDQLDSIISQTTENACELIYNQCDGNLQSVNPPFFCAQAYDCTVSPPSLQQMSTEFSDPSLVRLKPLIPSGCGPYSNDNCTVVRCGESCGDNNIQQLASGATQLQSAGRQTDDCSNEWVEGKDLDNCTYLFDRIGIAPQVSTCNDLEDAFGLLSAGMMLLGASLVAAAILAGCPLKTAEYREFSSGSPIYGYVAPSAYGTGGTPVAYASPVSSPPGQASPYAK